MLILRTVDSSPASPGSNGRLTPSQTRGRNGLGGGEQEGSHVWVPSPSQVQTEFLSPILVTTSVETLSFVSWFIGTKLWVSDHRPLHPHLSVRVRVGCQRYGNAYAL